MKLLAKLFLVAFLAATGFVGSANAVILGTGASCASPAIYGPCVAIGDGATGSIRGIAIGPNSWVSPLGDGISIGHFARSNLNSIALGNQTDAGGWNSVAIGGSTAPDGWAAVASNNYAIALGYGSQTDRDWQVSVGRPGNERVISNVAAGTAAHDAVIYQQVVPALHGIVSGLGAGATYDPVTGLVTAPAYSLSMGTYDNVGDALVALDNKPSGGGDNPYFRASGDPSVHAHATAYRATAGGEGANADAEEGTAFGARSQVTFAGGSAYGAWARANAVCTSLGYNSECNEHFTVSVGSAGNEHRIVNVAPGMWATDAANMGQLNAAVSGFGGGAGFVHGVFMEPTFTFSDGASFTNVHDALMHLEGMRGTGDQGPAGPRGADGRSAYEIAVENGFVGSEPEWIASLKGDPGDPGQRGEDGRDGTGGSNVVAGSNIEVSDNDDGTQTVSLADNIELTDQGSLTVGSTTFNGQGVTIQGGPSMTVNGIDAGNQRVTSVADGRIEQGSTDAVNGGQIWALQSQWNDQWTEINSRIDQTNDRIDALGAQSAAMSMMTGSSGSLAVGEVALGAGVGFYGNKAAMAVGLKGRASERSTWSIGISVGNGGKPMGGVGYSYTFGR